MKNKSNEKHEDLSTKLEILMTIANEINGYDTKILYKCKDCTQKIPKGFFEWINSDTGKTMTRVVSSALHGKWTDKDEYNYETQNDAMFLMKWEERCPMCMKKLFLQRIHDMIQDPDKKRYFMERVQKEFKDLQ